MSPTSSSVTTPDGINWYCEQQGHGPDLILVPSGEGDCASYAKIAAILSSSFKVTTFDMPGMSRTTAPPSAFENLTVPMIANQIIGLMDKLSIASASVYGCSSGGAIVLALVAHHPQRIRSAVVHEVPFQHPAAFANWPQLDDAAIVQACTGLFVAFNEDLPAWEALGPEYHARLQKNYVTWVREYVGKLPLSPPVKEEITRRPVTWTIGALMAAGMFFDNVVAACNAGIPISLLPSKHFPQVSIPDQLAEHIQTSVARMEKSS